MQETLNYIFNSHSGSKLLKFRHKHWWHVGAQAQNLFVWAKNTEHVTFQSGWALCTTRWMLCGGLRPNSELHPFRHFVTCGAGEGHKSRQDTFYSQKGSNKKRTNLQKQSSNIRSRPDVVVVKLSSHEVEKETPRRIKQTKNSGKRPGTAK